MYYVYKYNCLPYRSIYTHPVVDLKGFPLPAVITVKMKKFVKFVGYDLMVAHTIIAKEILVCFWNMLCSHELVPFLHDFMYSIEKLHGVSFVFCNQFNLVPITLFFSSKLISFFSCFHRSNINVTSKVLTWNAKFYG